MLDFVQYVTHDEYRAPKAAPKNAPEHAIDFNGGISELAECDRRHVEQHLDMIGMYFVSSGYIVLRVSLGQETRHGQVFRDQLQL